MALHGGEQLGNGIASYSNGKAKKCGEMRWLSRVTHSHAVIGCGMARESFVTKCFVMAKRRDAQL